MDGENKEDPTLAESQLRLDAIEVKLVESEHRWPHIIRNFVERKQWPQGHPKRKAAKLAIIWRVFAPATVVLTAGAGGFVVAVLTILEFQEQNASFREQNAAFREQNKEIQAQGLLLNIQTN